MINTINGIDFINLVDYAAKCLTSDYERINSLNVFPVPDGDTGTNMKMTIDGGVTEGNKNPIESIGKVAKNIARSMVLSARGNSGVITSQFFKGLSIGLADKDSVDVNGWALAMIEGYKKAYSVVSNPTEGTILTVMREASDNTYKDIANISSLEDYFTVFLKHAYVSLENTPNLLPVLKKAGVIDSGGAGFCLIIEGMLKYAKGEVLENVMHVGESKVVDTSGFNADSELTYGYCTEFILQLQNSKVSPENFDLKIINEYLESIGDSIVSFKDEDIVKVHVHTFNPGQVLTEMRKYGEFLTLKIENMNVGHTEAMVATEAAEPVSTEKKQYAVVAVANGSGLVKAFKELGVDEVVSGGQTMNTSTEDFIKAFDKINADNIFVYPNNSNIKMAAKMAAENYTKANVYVIETRTLAEGYSAVSMLNFDAGTIDEVIAEQKECISNVSTLEVTYSVRNCTMNDIDIHKGDYICIYNNELIACNPSRLDAVKEALCKIEDFADKQVMTVLCGIDTTVDEFNDIQSYAQTLNSYIELYPVEGKQDIYSYIIGIE